MKGVLWKWTNYWNGEQRKHYFPFHIFSFYFGKGGKHGGLCWKMGYSRIINHKRKSIRAARARLKYKLAKLMVRTF